MKILLTTLHVAYMLTTERPKETEGETLKQTRARQKWDNDDFICMGHILNGCWMDSLTHIKMQFLQRSFRKDLRQEEEYRNQEDTKNNAQESVHITEDGKTKSHKKRSHHSKNANKNKVANKQKKDNCFFCGKAGHYKVECRLFKKKRKEKEKGSDSSSKDLVAMISKFNLVDDDDKAWWLDSGATRHVCKSKALLKSPKESDGTIICIVSPKDAYFE
ncbi:hypothetical protein ACH5RR_003389 [Cinchona calisaya]|uniref:CCHC-type domain-containing protein n=1 Tax=Cinchona calisaya TaxID=153742 RepID=A0ABD3AUU4_9GENT